MVRKSGKLKANHPWMGPDHSRGRTLEKLYGHESTETTGDPRLFTENTDDIYSATTVLDKTNPN